LNSASEDFQAGGGGILLKGGDGLGMVAEKLLDDLGGLVTTAKPDDFGGPALQSGHVCKIGVLGHQDESVGFGVLLKDGVISLGQAKQADLTGTGEEVGEGLTEFEAEVLVEQQLHAAVKRRRSRSAA
jgi:hypothetical protein